MPAGVGKRMKARKGKNMRIPAAAGCLRSLTPSKHFNSV